MGVAAALGFAAVVATPTAPWSYACLLVLLGLAGLRDPRLLRLGVVAAWTIGVDGAGLFLLVPAIVLGALAWSRVATGLLVVGLLLAAKQSVAAWELPAARDVVPALLVTTVLAATAWAAATPRKGERRASAVAGALAVTATGLVLAGRFGWVFTLDGPERLAAARRVHAEAWVYDGLLADPTMGPALVLAVPDRDEAALRLPVEEALDLGWRPRLGGDDPIPVALVLERRGRGGEALRMLARHPRTGAVDWYRGLFERTQGEEVRWEGGVPPGVARLPGEVSLDLRWDTNAYAAVPFQADADLVDVRLAGAGTPFEGPPSVRVRLDGTPVRTWTLDGAGSLILPGPLPRGPHRVELRFESDRVGAGGDRNVRIDTLVGR